MTDIEHALLVRELVLAFDRSSPGFYPGQHGAWSNRMAEVLDVAKCKKLWLQGTFKTHLQRRHPELLAKVQIYMADYANGDLPNESSKKFS